MIAANTPHPKTETECLIFTVRSTVSRVNLTPPTPKPSKSLYQHTGNKIMQQTPLPTPLLCCVVLLSWHCRIAHRDSIRFDFTSRGFGTPSFCSSYFLQTCVRACVLHESKQFRIYSTAVSPIVPLSFFPFFPPQNHLNSSLHLSPPIIQPPIRNPGSQGANANHH